MSELRELSSFFSMLIVFYYYLKATKKTEKQIYRNLLQYVMIIFGMYLLFLVINIPRQNLFILKGLIN